MTVAIRRAEPRIDADAAVQTFMYAPGMKSERLPLAQQVELVQLGYWRVAVQARGEWRARKVRTDAGGLAAERRRHALAMDAWERTGRRGAAPKPPKAAGFETRESIRGRCDERIELFVIAGRSALPWRFRGLHPLLEQYGRQLETGGEAAPVTEEPGRSKLPELKPAIGQRLRQTLRTRLLQEHDGIEALDVDFTWDVISAQRHDHPFWLILHADDDDCRIAAVDAVGGTLVGSRKSLFIRWSAWLGRGLFASAAFAYLALCTRVDEPYEPPPQVARPAPPAKPVPALPPPIAQTEPETWIVADDYPPAALRDERQGTTLIEWDVDARGLISACRVISTSGWADLDKAACDAIQRRGSYLVAPGEKRPVVATYSRRVRWVIPE